VILPPQLSPQKVIDPSVFPIRACTFFGDRVSFSPHGYLPRTVPKEKKPLEAEGLPRPFSPYATLPDKKNESFLISNRRPSGESQASGAVVKEFSSSVSSKGLPVLEKRGQRLDELTSRFALSLVPFPEMDRAKKGSVPLRIFFWAFFPNFSSPWQPACQRDSLILLRFLFRSFCVTFSEPKEDPHGRRSIPCGSYRRRPFSPYLKPRVHRGSDPLFWRGPLLLSRSFLQSKSPRLRSFFTFL